MIRSAVGFVVALVAGATVLSPAGRASSPIAITACQTIKAPGSYVLASNLTAKGDCLVITADLVTIDLAGFSITGPAILGSAAGVRARNGGTGIVVQNGSISNFGTAVDLSSAQGSIVEGLRAFDNGTGIVADGTVRGNTVVVTFEDGIDASGTVTSNYLIKAAHGVLLRVGPGSTVSGNTAISLGRPGEDTIVVSCPSNVTGNTATGAALPGHNLLLHGTGCSAKDNVAP
jgi:hypothetical protein